VKNLDRLAKCFHSGEAIEIASENDIFFKDYFLEVYYRCAGYPKIEYPM